MRHGLAAHLALAGARLMPLLDVRLHLEAVVPVASADAPAFRERLQAALDAVTVPLLDAGAQIAGDVQLEAKVRADDARGEGGEG